jgi:hypothetical protein
MTQLEPETAMSVSTRRRRGRVRLLAEFALAATFVASVRAADHFAETAGPGAALPAVFAGAAIVALAAWFAAYVFWHRRLDEFERVIEERAIALAAGATILFAAAWGVLEVTLDAPDFPIALLAPAFALVYAAVRFVISSGYR